MEEAAKAYEFESEVAKTAQEEKDVAWLIRQKEKWEARRKRRKGRMADAWAAARSKHLHNASVPAKRRSPWQAVVGTVRAPPPMRAPSGQRLVPDHSCQHCSSYSRSASGVSPSPRSRGRSDASPMRGPQSGRLLARGAGAG